MPLQKDQILAELALMDLARLQKLYTYAQNLLIPEDDLLVNVTMSQMLEKAFSLADIDFPQWTDRSKSDFGRFIVELVALFSEKDFWYINAFAGEAILDTMTVYSDAFVKAVNMGYEPALCRASSALFDVTFAAGAEIKYKRGELILALNGSGLQFTNDEEITVAASGAQTTLPLRLSEGTQFSITQAYNGHSIQVPKAMTDIESVWVVINNLRWVRVRTFGRSASNSEHFVVIPQENGSFTVFFGEDGYGLKPALGENIRVFYRTTKGADSNSAQANPITIVKSSSTRGVVSAFQKEAATGGQNPESLASIKKAAPLYFSSKKAAINATVTEELLKTYTEVLKAKVSVVGNNVYFRVIPKDGTVAGSPLLDTIKTRIGQQVMEGYNVLGQPTTYITTGPIQVNAFLLPGYNAAEAQTNIAQLIEDYTNPLVLAEYGKDFVLSDVVLFLQSRVAGLQNVVFVQVAGAAPANIVVQETEIMQKTAFNQITVNVIQ